MLQPASAPVASTFTYYGHTLYRRYGASLQSSLTRVLPRALEYSSHPPVSVYGTGYLLLNRLRSFSRLDGITGSPAAPKGFGGLSGLGLSLGGFAYPAAYTLRARIPSRTPVSPKRPSFAS